MKIISINLSNQNKLSSNSAFSIEKVRVAKNNENSDGITSNYTLWLAGEYIPKYSPVIYDGDTQMLYVAKASNINHLNRYFGLALEEKDAGETVRVRSNGTLEDPEFSWSVEREVYISPTGTLTQDLAQYGEDPTSQLVYQQKVANVLTPTHINLSNGFEPILLQ